MLSYEQKVNAQKKLMAELEHARTASVQPNSELLRVLGDEGGFGLEDAMEERMQQQFLGRQIGSAEREADTLAASVRGASTPEQVKAALGERLGADFSEVRFHMDSHAAAQADAMGAQAFTKGQDVYFGQGGFSPELAAHELVHTVQQGFVESAAQTEYAPAQSVQMKPKSPRELAEERNAKANAKLAKMSPEAIQRILAGKGGRFEKKKFAEIMKVLNGKTSESGAGGELSGENIARFYDMGGAARNFIVNRTLDNMVTHIQGKHAQLSGGGAYDKTGVDHEKYMSTLQNSGVREGNGGALKEYGLLAAHLSKPMVEQMSGIANWTEGGAPAPAKGTEEFDAKAQENAAVLTQSLPGIIDTAGQDFRGYNQTFLQKLQTAMPDTVGQDNDTAEAFLAKSSALRGFFPQLVNGMDTQTQALGVRASQRGLQEINAMMDPREGGGLAHRTANALAYQKSLFPAAPAPAAAPAAAPPVQGVKTSDALAYRQPGMFNPGDGYNPTTASDDQTLAMLWQKIKNPSPDDDPAIIAWRKKEFARIRAAQMKAKGGW